VALWIKEEWKGIRETIDMDRIDSYFLERCDEMRRWSGTCDDGSDGFRQFPNFGVVYETDLLEVASVKG